MQTVTNLNQFKEFVKANLNNPNIKLSSKVVKNGTGEVIRENPPAVIAHVQTNSFAVDRNGNLSWMEFGKAKDWLFSGDTAKHNTMGSNPNFCHLIFTIHKKETYYAISGDKKEHYTFRAESIEDAKQWVINHLDTSLAWQVGKISDRPDLTKEITANI